MSFLCKVFTTFSTVVRFLTLVDMSDVLIKPVLPIKQFVTDLRGFFIEVPRTCHLKTLLDYAESCYTAISTYTVRPTLCETISVKNLVGRLTFINLH